MDFIIRFLANFFASFKIKNPAVAAVVLVVLASAVATVENGMLYGVIPVSGWLQEVIKYVGIFLTAVTGSQTWQYLETGDKKK
jgi:chromate transport protein ChrA